jgi:hypothetical protein
LIFQKWAVYDSKTPMQAVGLHGTHLHKTQRMQMIVFLGLLGKMRAKENAHDWIVDTYRKSSSRSGSGSNQDVPARESVFTS